MQILTSNLATARHLGELNELGIRWNSRLDAQPPALNPNIDLTDRVEGMMLGLAIGDALGNTHEGMLPSYRSKIHGWISDYRPNCYAGHRCVGSPSDDTQLAYWTLEHLNQHRGLIPQQLGEIFSSRRIFGIGSSTRQFLRNFKNGIPWEKAGAPSTGGNGALMRIAPVLIAHLHTPSSELWGDTLLAAHLTHRGSLSTSSCLAFIDMLWRLLGRDSLPEQGWWLETFASTLEDIEGEQSYSSRAPRLSNFDGKLSTLLRNTIAAILGKNLNLVEAANEWYSGAYLLETVPTVIYILERYGNDLEMAMLQAVNNTKDNDTIAAIVGAAMGALYGRKMIPKSWQDGLLGRTGEHDDKQVFKLLQQAGDLFNYGVSDYVRQRAA